MKKREQHGDKGKRLYTTWCNMKARCANKDNLIYGGKGISVCNDWLNSYLAFKQWSLNNGYTDILTIDRIDSAGNYEPSNCRWVDSKTQNNNTSRNIIIDDTTLTLKCEELGIDPRLVQARVREQSLTFEQAIELPQNFRHYRISYNGSSYSLKELCRELSMNYDTVYKRIKKYNKTLQEATECKACQWVLDNKEA